jgi:hypothetical protein
MGTSISTGTMVLPAPVPFGNETVSTISNCILLLLITLMTSFSLQQLLIISFTSFQTEEKTFIVFLSSSLTFSSKPPNNKKERLVCNMVGPTIMGLFGRNILSLLLRYFELDEQIVLLNFLFSRQALAQEQREQLILKQGIRRKQPICPLAFSSVPVSILATLFKSCFPLLSYIEFS